MLPDLAGAAQLFASGNPGAGIQHLWVWAWRWSEPPLKPLAIGKDGQYLFLLSVVYLHLRTTWKILHYWLSCVKENFVLFLYSILIFRLWKYRLKKKDGPHRIIKFVLGIWIWYLEARSRYWDFGNICFKFSLECSIRKKWFEICPGIWLTIFIVVSSTGLWFVVLFFVYYNCEIKLKNGHLFSFLVWSKQWKEKKKKF